MKSETNQSAGSICVSFTGLSPKQKQFCQARSRYIAYGGARGGGKTHVLRMKAIGGALRYPGIRILIVRRQYPELEMSIINPMRAVIPPQLAKYNGTLHMFFFQNHSTIKFGHYSIGDDVEYQGQEYDWIFIDEATQFSEDQFLILGACLRGTTQIPRRIYLTCNPGGIGHFWVKRLFVDRCYRENEQPDDYTFIPATVYDNPSLLKHSPDYIKQLELLPENRRAAWLHGDWDALSGIFFPEIRPEIHQISDFWRIPKDWKKYRAIDYGLDMFACIWVAQDYDGRNYVYREYQRPNLIVSEAARKMQELTPEWEEISATIAPSDIWNRQKDSGKSMADIFGECGVGLLHASSNRIQGWMAVHELLKPLKHPEDRPGLLFCKSCSNLFDSIRTIQHDENKVDDCAKEPHDITHTCDALRYYSVTRLMAAKRPEALEPPDLDNSSITNYDDYMTGGEAAENYLDYNG